MSSCFHVLTDLLERHLRTANVKNSFVVREFFGDESSSSNLFFWLQPKAEPSSLRLGGELPPKGWLGLSGANPQFSTIWGLPSVDPSHPESVLKLLRLTFEFLFF